MLNLERSGKIWKDLERMKRISQKVAARHLNSPPGCHQQFSFEVSHQYNPKQLLVLLVYVGLGASLKFLFQNNLWPDLFDRYRLETAGPTGFEIVP